VLVLGTVLGATTGIAGLAVADISGDDPWVPPPGAAEAVGTPDQLSAQRDEAGPGLNANDAVAQTLRNLGDASVISANIFQPTAEEGAIPESGPWLNIRIDSNQGDSIRPVWLGQLVQGAVADEMRTDEATTSDVLDGAQVVDTDESGKSVTIPLGHGAVVGGQEFNSPSDALLTDRVQKVADKFGIKVSSVEVLHPLDSALAATFVVSDGKVDWTITQLTNAIEGSPSDIEGLYVELVSPSGDPLLQASRALRIPGGGLWFADGQDDRFGANHG
jgi:hypothetical protein